MMKMVMIVYNEAMESDVMEALGGCAMDNYTKVTGVYGKGAASGTHLGNDIWPGRNNLIYVACDPGHAQQLCSCVRALRAKFGHEGVKAFVMPMDEMT